MVGKDIDFTIYEDEDIAQYLALIEGEEKSSGAGAKEQPQAMEADDAPPAADPQPAGPETMDQQ